MTWVTVVLLVLSPALLYGLALVGSVLERKYCRRRCLACFKRGLRCFDFVRATIVVDGKRAPDWWADYRCERCGAVYRRRRDSWVRVREGDQCR